MGGSRLYGFSLKMCIRDSIITGAAGHLGNTIIRMLKGREIVIRGLLLPHETGAAVSYTHLDVYKRQPANVDTGGTGGL